MKRLNELALQKIALLNNIPFAAYRLPWRTEVHHVFSYSMPRPYYSFKDIEHLSGFVMHPFQVSAEFPIYLFSPDKVITSNNLTPEILEELRSKKLPFQPEKPLQNATLQKEYYKQFKLAGNLFESKTLEKIVLSRVIYLKKANAKMASNIFHKLYLTYPSSFLFMVNLPGHGIWIGASPEMLLNMSNAWFQTVSLAGTKPFKGLELPQWGAKEISEQAIVTNFIKHNLEDSGIMNIEIVGPETVRAANLWHLQTIFRFPANNVHIHTTDLINRLHPTPAVSGFPKEEATYEILKIEQHKREYYTGFLGTWNMNQQHHLFVNLRSMRINAQGANLFVGGGITPDSDMHDEWEETENKSKTMLSVIEQNN